MGIRDLVQQQNEEDCENGRSPSGDMSLADKMSMWEDIRYRDGTPDTIAYNPYE
jgi:hypothetical protein